MTSMTSSGGTRTGNIWRIAVWGVAAGLWLLPLVAMRFTAEVIWTGSDFVVWGTMLGAACGAYELATRVASNTVYRAAAGVAVVTTFLLVWINLAVGVIDAETNPANLMFAGVVAVGVVGSIIGRFRAAGMARALIATALAQLTVALIVLILGWSDETGIIIGVTVMFVTLWLGSAWLFRKAART